MVGFYLLARLFTCPDDGCQQNVFGEQVFFVDSPRNLPQLGRDAVHLGGGDIAQYLDSSSEGVRFICSTSGRGFKLSAYPQANDGEPADNPGNAGNCDYSSAAINDGWGWEPLSGQSCPPLDAPVIADDCDYSDAAVNAGWGWNPVSRKSCAPR